MPHVRAPFSVGVTGGTTTLVTVTVTTGDVLAANPAAGAKRAVSFAAPTVASVALEAAMPSFTGTASPRAVVPS